MQRTSTIIAAALACVLIFAIVRVGFELAEFRPSTFLVQN